MALNLDSILNWTFRTGAMRAARGQLVKSGDTTQRFVRQVRLSVETARRVTDPADALPSGSYPTVLLALYREAIYWMLAALNTADSAPKDLATLWAATDPDTLLRAAGDHETLAAIHRALVEPSPASALNATDEDAERLRAFVESLLREFDAPKRRVDQVHLQRWTGIALAAAILVLGGLGVRRLALGPNLAEGRTLRASSNIPECQPHNCADLMFHTAMENNPWAEIDLAAVRSIHRVEVANRSDCCEERAVPLIIEVSLDDKKWTEVARRDTQFSSWVARFPPVRTRYVRLRVPRVTLFHLEEIAVR